MPNCFVASSRCRDTASGDSAAMMFLFQPLLVKFVAVASRAQPHLLPKHQCHATFVSFCGRCKNHARHILSGPIVHCLGVLTKHISDGSWVWGLFLGPIAMKSLWRYIGIDFKSGWCHEVVWVSDL
eukprot:8111082-Pyramimonas_sp.AAC.1